MNRFAAIFFPFLLILSAIDSNAADSTAFEAPRKTFRWLDAKTSPDPNRTILLTGGLSLLYAGSMLWLYSEWYSNYPSSSFHLFNDGNEWEQMDKFAHCWDAYSIAKPVYHTYRWAGWSNKNAALFGAGISFMFQSTVEVFDGFSTGWGFSMYDMAANAAGTAFFLSQQLGWGEQRMVLKYSLHTTPYSAYRPDVLGKNFPERLLKDYNGLTYWVSVNPASFMKSSTLKFPNWLSLAIGFGAEGMTGGDSNPTEINGKPIPSFERYQQYYLGVDFDLARIKTKNRLLKDVFRLINIVHLPAPAIEFSPGRRTKWHALYF